MSANITLGQSMKGFETSPRFEPFSKVKLIVDDNTTYEAGNDSGRTLEVECCFGSQAMANNILTQIKDYSYQPYSAKGAFANPAIELGDAINAKGIYSGIFKYSVTFGRQLSFDLSADSDEELEHEFGYYSEDGGYVTYSSLKNGTAAINGSGLINGTVNGDDKLAQGSVSGGGGGGGGSGAIKAGSLNSGDCISSVQSALGGGALAASAFNSNARVTYMNTNHLYIGGTEVVRGSIKVGTTSYAVYVPAGGVA